MDLEHCIQRLERARLQADVLACGLQCILVARDRSPLPALQASLLAQASQRVQDAVRLLDELLSAEEITQRIPAYPRSRQP